MSQEGYADPIMNDGPGFRSIIPVSKLTERVTRVVEVKTINPLYFFIIISYIHTHIHSIRPCPPDDSGPEPLEGSGTKPSHVQRNASQCSVLRHEAAVASFKHEQRPTRV